MPAAEMHMFICVHFLPHANPSRQTSGQKVKKMHTLYIHPKPHFQPAAVLPTAQSLLSHPANLPAAGRNIPNNYSPTSHFAGIYNAAKPSNHNATTTIHQKEVHTYPAAGIYIFFRPFFPLPSKRQTWSIHPTVEEKREKGV